jgi:hypothetical protein
MTTKYKLVNQNGVFDSVLKTDDADSSVYMSIPKESANRDYQEYLSWVSAGNTAEAAD